MLTFGRQGQIWSENGYLWLFMQFKMILMSCLRVPTYGMDYHIGTQDSSSQAVTPAKMGKIECRVGGITLKEYLGGNESNYYEHPTTFMADIITMNSREACEAFKPTRALVYLEKLPSYSLHPIIIHHQYSSHPPFYTDGQNIPFNSNDEIAVKLRNYLLLFFDTIPKLDIVVKLTKNKNDIAFEYNKMLGII